MSQSPQVIIVGSYVQDQAWFVERFPRPGETMRANRYNTGPGGKGFNQAVACARQGVPTAFVGVLGRDTFAEFAKRFADAEGMPCRWQIRDDQPTSTSSITVNAKAENQIAMIFGANEHLDASFVRAQDDLFAGAKTLLIQLENNLDALQAALDMGAKHGLTRIMNPAPVAADLSFDMLRSADIITPNETEFSLLLERFCEEGSRSGDARRARQCRPACALAHARRRDRRRHARLTRLLRLARREPPRRHAIGLSAAARKGQRDRHDRRRRRLQRRADCRTRPLCRQAVPRCRDPRQSRRRDVDRNRRHGAGDADLRCGDQAIRHGLKDQRDLAQLD